MKYVPYKYANWVRWSTLTIAIVVATVVTGDSSVGRRLLIAFVCGGVSAIVDRILLGRGRRG